MTGREQFHRSNPSSMKAMSLREALSDPDSDFRRMMNESWMDYVCSKLETDGVRPEVEDEGQRFCGISESS